jgi:uncharacterized protein
VVMSSLIRDNGIVSDLHRGAFFGYRGDEGALEGVALIGHSTLIEARSDDAIRAFAAAARSAATPIHMIMSAGTTAERFWDSFAGGVRRPRVKCIERLFEVSLPFLVTDCPYDIVPAREEHLEQVAAAQAEIAFLECGRDPLVVDPDGFRQRVLRRIRRGRVFVAVENGEMIFKADIIAEAGGTVYLEGVYVAPRMRNGSVGAACLARLNRDLLQRAERICLLSNVEFTEAHECYLRAGFRNSDEQVTLFV